VGILGACKFIYGCVFNIRTGLKSEVRLPWQHNNCVSNEDHSAPFPSLVEEEVTALGAHKILFRLDMLQRQAFVYSMFTLWIDKQLKIFSPASHTAACGLYEIAMRCFVRKCPSSV
jgi:hypothetical protein